MIVCGQMGARGQLSWTIFDYHKPFDQGLSKQFKKNLFNANKWLKFKLLHKWQPRLVVSFIQEDFQLSVIYLLEGFSCTMQLFVLLRLNKNVSTVCHTILIFGQTRFCTQSVHFWKITSSGSIQVGRQLRSGRVRSFARTTNKLNKISYLSVC